MIRGQPYRRILQAVIHHDQVWELTLDCGHLVLRNLGVSAGGAVPKKTHCPWCPRKAGATPEAATP